MYRGDNYYQIIDNLKFDLEYATYKNKKDATITRVIVKVFKNDSSKVIIETINMKDHIIFDNRQNNEDLLTMNLTFLKVLERITIKTEEKITNIEHMSGIGSWIRTNFLDKEKSYSSKEIIKELFKDL